MGVSHLRYEEQEGECTYLMCVGHISMVDPSWSGPLLIETGN